MPEAKVFSAEDLRAGLKVTYEVDISEEDILIFARLSGDYNPLHVDVDYARTSNYEGRIVHGAFQISLASALLGMHLPGQKVLLGTLNARFPSPLYFPGRVKVSGEITTWNMQTLGGQLKVIIQEAVSLMTTSEIFMSFTLHEERKSHHTETPAPVTDKDVEAGSARQRKLVLVTGAAGGLGTHLVAALAGNYDVVALVNRQPLDESVRALASVREIRTNISAPGFEDQIATAVNGRSIYGLVHAAWPGAPRGSLLQSDDEGH
jgi:acyl dehydratase